MIDESTICAISTAPGTGAIAIIRLSGSEAVNICDKLFVPAKKGNNLLQQKGNTVHFGTISDNNKIIDEVLVSIFKNPHSYTGEDLVEVACHGSLYIQQKILQLFINNGVRLAKPGEFTMRAFFNGKMDLSQAEAVADLIASTTEASHKVAVQQMRGGFSNEIKILRDRLLKFISLIELELDFSEEDVEFADRKDLKKLVNEIKALISRLINSFELGNVIKNGVPVAIVGNPNVGKSTLLNILLNENRAIVSEIPGTTRDVIEDTININGISFRFIDTAGLHETQDKIETLGIEKTYEKINIASIVLLLVDAQDEIKNIEYQISNIKKIINDKKFIVIVNKTDKLNDSELKTKINSLKNNDYSLIDISAINNINIDTLTNELIKTVNLSSLNANDVIVTNARHYEALVKAKENILRVIQGLDDNISGDFIAMDIRQVLHYLGEITGEITTDEVLGNIFKNFCIGK